MMFSMTMRFTTPYLCGCAQKIVLQGKGGRRVRCHIWTELCAHAALPLGSATRGRATCTSGVCEVRLAYIYIYIYVYKYICICIHIWHIYTCIYIYPHTRQSDSTLTELWRRTRNECTYISTYIHRHTRKNASRSQGMDPGFRTPMWRRGHCRRNAGTHWSVGRTLFRQPHIGGTGSQSCGATAAGLAWPRKWLVWRLYMCMYAYDAKDVYY